MKEFGRGLPVKQVNPKAPRVPEQNQQGGTFGRALADIPNDVATSFKNSLGVIGDTGTNIKEAFTTPGLSIPQRAAGAISAPISGAVNLAAEGITGAGRLLTTPEFEEQLNGAIAQGGEAALNSEWGKWAVKQYEALPDEQKYTLTNIIGPVANTMTAGIGGVGAKQVASQGLRSIQNTLRSGAKTAGKDVVERTSQDAAQAVLTAANPVEAAGNPVVDTIKGAATQIKDFATRTSREAQETASESRRMAQMPKEKGTLIKNGADEKVVNVIDRSTPEEVSIYRELVQQAKAKESDPTPNTPQPKVIAGREFMKPVQFLIDERKKVGTQLGERRKGLSTETDIDTNVAFRQFHEYLVDNKGAKFDTDGKILTDSGTLASSDIPKIQELYDQLASGKLNSEAELDSWLQRSLKDFDLVQKREKTFSDEVSSIAGVARGYVGELMPADYNALRKQYAEMSTPLSDMVKLLGYKGNLDEFSAKELKISEVALRVLGNAADRPQSVIDGVLDTAKANGYASTVDLNKLIYVTDQLEDLYDITPTRGFSGSTARGNNQSSAGIATDAATFNVGGLFDRAMSSRASQKEIQESFEAYLNSIGEGTGTPGTFKPGQTVKDEGAAKVLDTERVTEEVSAMLEKVPESKIFIDDIADEVSAGVDGDVRVAKAPPKSLERSVQKVVEEEGGDSTQLRDLARNSIVPMTPAGRDQAIKLLSERTDLAKEPKFQTPEKFSGYAGVIFNIKTPNGLIAEIQVVEPNMIFGKMLPEDSINILGKDLFDKISAETGIEPGYGHKLYEDMRELSVADLEGPEGQRLRQESVDYYNKLR